MINYLISIKISNDSSDKTSLQHTCIVRPVIGSSIFPLSLSCFFSQLESWTMSTVSLCLTEVNIPAHPDHSLWQNFAVALGQHNRFLTADRIMYESGGNPVHGRHYEAKNEVDCVS